MNITIMNNISIINTNTAIMFIMNISLNLSQILLYNF